MLLPSANDDLFLPPWRKASYAWEHSHGKVRIRAELTPSLRETVCPGFVRAWQR
jgi:hypothetical protein